MRLVAISENMATVYDNRKVVAVFEINDQTTLTSEIIEEIRTDNYDDPDKAA